MYVTLLLSSPTWMTLHYPSPSMYYLSNRDTTFIWFDSWNFISNWFCDTFWVYFVRWCNWDFTWQTSHDKPLFQSTLNTKSAEENMALLVFNNYTTYCIVAPSTKMTENNQSMLFFSLMKWGNQTLIFCTHQHEQCLY